MGELLLGSSCEFFLSNCFHVRADTGGEDCHVSPQVGHELQLITTSFDKPKLERTHACTVHVPYSPPCLYLHDMARPGVVSQVPAEMGDVELPVGYAAPGPLAARVFDVLDVLGLHALSVGGGAGQGQCPSRIHELNVLQLI